MSGPVVVRCGEGDPEGFGKITYRGHVWPICTCESSDEWIHAQTEQVKERTTQLIASATSNPPTVMSP